MIYFKSNEISLLPAVSGNYSPVRSRAVAYEHDGLLVRPNRDMCTRMNVLTVTDCGR